MQKSAVKPLIVVDPLENMRHNQSQGSVGWASKKAVGKISDLLA